MSGSEAEGVRWAGRTLTWSFAAGTYAKDVFTPFDGAIAGPDRAVIAGAFAEWGAASGLRFVNVADSPDPAQAADVRIGWSDLSTGSAGGDVIGHASWTEAAGLLQPDVTIQLENPADIGPAGGPDPYSGFGTSLLQVALHEIGHAIGLAHSDDPASVMYPFVGRGTGALAASDAAAAQAIYPAWAPAPQGDILIADATSGFDGRLRSSPTSGGDPDISRMWVEGGSDSVNLWATLPGSYITTGAGDDAIGVVSGNNVINAGAGSNYLTGGAGHDTFFVALDPKAQTWDTIVNFHAGDVLTIWRYVGDASHLTWTEGQGAKGATGATLHIASAAGGPDEALVTFAGLTRAQASHFAVQTSASQGVPFLAFFA